MNREQAYALVCEYTQSDSLRKHMLAVEAALRAYAGKFAADADSWGIVGLLHDFDYGAGRIHRTTRSKAPGSWPSAAIRPR